MYGEPENNLFEDSDGVLFDKSSSVFEKIFKTALVAVLEHIDSAFAVLETFVFFDDMSRMTSFHVTLLSCQRVPNFEPDVLTVVSGIGLL